VRYYNPLGIRGICHFSIPCKDIERSLTFYETIVGAKLIEDEHGPYKIAYGEDGQPRTGSHMFIDVAGARIELLQQDPAGNIPFGTHHAFAIGPNDVHVIEGHLEEHGIPYRGPIHSGHEAVSIYFLDPDGNKLEFCSWDGFRGADRYPTHRDAPRQDTAFEWDPEARKAKPAATA
jgi:catechol 2,3-dioxygenase-like lactoylglutathione lyase family enzyme